MKTFPAAFAAEKNKKTGIVPLWILKLTVGGVDYYLSDSAFTLPSWQGGVTTLPWVSRWGRVSEGISGAIDEISIADLDIELVIDPDAAPNAEDLAEATDLEASAVSLYLWLSGLDDAAAPPQEFLRGYVRGAEIPDDTAVRLIIEDESVSLEGYVGTRVTRIAYPSADPDDVGKVIPIPIGPVKRLPALAVDAGAMTSLPNTIDSTTTSVAVSDAWGLAAGKTIQVDDEQMYIQSVAGDTLTVTRGYNATLAAGHLKGAMAWERKAEFVYLASDVPVDSIDKVLGRVGEAEVDITAVCTLYTGQPGSEHAAHPGRAAVSIPGYVTVSQAVDLLVTNGTLALGGEIVVTNGTLGATLSGVIAQSGEYTLGGNIQDYSVSQGSHAHTGQTLTTTKEFDYWSFPSGTGSGNAWIDGSVATSAILNNNAIVKIERVMPFSQAGTPIRYRIGVRHGSSTYSGRELSYSTNGTGYSAWSGVSTPTTSYSGWVTAADWDSVPDAIWLKPTNAEYVEIWEAWLEVEYSTATAAEPATGVSKVAANNGTLGLSGGTSVDNGTLGAGLSGNVSKTGDKTLDGSVALSGNSVANTLVGDSILVNLTRAFADPAAAMQDFIDRYCGGYALQQVGALPGSYALNGAITDYRRKRDWLHKMAWELRGVFRLQAAAARLIVRPDAPVSVKTIPACRVAGGRRVLSRRKTPLEEVINKLELLYERDWSQGDSDAAYRSASSGSDAQSIADYGERQRPELFRMDFVTDPAHADSLRDFYLARYKRRRWRCEFEVFLDHCELEFADAVTLGFLGGQIGETQEVGYSPGDTSNIDVIGLVVEV